MIPCTRMKLAVMKLAVLPILSSIVAPKSIFARSDTHGYTVWVMCYISRVKTSSLNSAKSLVFFCILHFVA